MRLLLSSSILALLLVSIGLPSSVDAHPEDVPAVRATLLAADALAIGAGVTVALAQPFGAHDEIGRLGRGTATALGVGLLAAPSIHWAYKHTNHGFLSAGTRALLPLATGTAGLLGLCMLRQSSGTCAREGMAYGTAVGTVVAAGLDALLITSMSQKTVDDPTEWYGWQTLLVDAAGVGFGVFLFTNRTGGAVSDGGLVIFPMTQWLGVWFVGTLGAPIVHMVNAEWLSAGGSIAMRALGGPALSLGGMIAYCAAVGGEDGCVATGASWGLMGSAFFMAALDALVFARKKIETPEVAPYIGPGVVGDQPGLIIATTF